MSVQPIKLYSHPGGPNPWKVAIILAELGIPYHSEILDFSQVKQPPFVTQFPNGRVPAIEDPNTGIKLWESGAIIEYILATYDKENKLSYTQAADAAKFWDQKAWLHFQTSGQGPYYGQRAWFLFYHPEKNLTSAIDRYGNEIKRVIGVINSHLKQQGTPYLIGDKPTYADLAFVPWHWLVAHPPHILGEDFPKEWEKEFPEAWAWNKRLDERPAVAKVREERTKAIQAGH